MKSRRLSAFLGALIIGGTTWGAVAPTAFAASSSAPKINPNGVITYAWAGSTGVPSWDPANTATQQDLPLLEVAYDRLFNLSSNGKTLEPDLATSWSWNKSNTVLTVDLRKHVKFQDGQAYNASVEVQNVIRLKAGIGAGPLTPMSAATAAGPYSVKIHFSSPDPAVIYYFGSMFSGVVSPSGMANPQALVTAPSGGGPFELSGPPDASLTYTMNRWKGYWDKGHVFPAQIKYTGIPVETTRLNSVIDGQINATYITGATYPEAYGNKSLHIANIPSLSPWGIRLNVNKAPLNNVIVRQAISMALNRPAYKADSDGLCLSVSSVFPKGMAGYSPSITATYNPTKAAQMIQQAGATGAIVTIDEAQSNPQQAYGPIIQNELDAIGLNAQLVSLNAGLVTNAWFSGQYGIYIGQATTNGPDFVGSMSTILTSYPGGLAAIPSDITNALDKAQTLPLGSAARTKAMEKLNQLMTNTDPIIDTLCQGYNTFISPTNVTGLYTMPYSDIIQVPNIEFLDVTQ